MDGTLKCLYIFTLFGNVDDELLFLGLVTGHVTTQITPPIRKQGNDVILLILANQTAKQ